VTQGGDLDAFMEHVIVQFEGWAEANRLIPKQAEKWLAKATGARAVLREMRRLQRVEELARAVDAIFDERLDVIRLRCRVADGCVDHREHFLKLRKSLEHEAVEEAKEPS
jgi:hypothetical protein